MAGSVLKNTNPLQMYRPLYQTRRPLLDTPQLTYDDIAYITRPIYNWEPIVGELQQFIDALVLPQRLIKYRWIVLFEEGDMDKTVLLNTNDWQGPVQLKPYNDIQVYFPLKVWTLWDEVNTCDACYKMYMH